ncbi:hypothetical protein ACFC5Z_35800 [Streptomyces sp. NPDC056004]|uniref:hypothetical protein n=1 Tax=unclassified Streptomyces TaxID=2593676 RepID=UPI0035E2E9C0
MPERRSVLSGGYWDGAVQLLELFLHREGRASMARETIRVDGDTVEIGAWLAKARTKHRVGQLPEDHARLVAALFAGDRTTEAARPRCPCLKARSKADGARARVLRPSGEPPAERKRPVGHLRRPGGPRSR